MGTMSAFCFISGGLEEPSPLCKTMFQFYLSWELSFGNVQRGEDACG